MDTNQDDRLKAMIIEADKRSFEGRLNRLRFLLEILGENYVPFPKIVLEYFEETKLCFYEGAFVASILMASATFEELFRQIYRDRSETKKAKSRGLADLVNRALDDSLIFPDEARRLTELRRMRNKFTHIKIGFQRIDFNKKRTFLDFLLLWEEPYKETLPIEDLAEDTIKIFARLLPKLCNRFWRAK